MSTPVSTLGIDAGASLCKLAFLNWRLETALLPSNETAAVRERIERWAPQGKREEVDLLVGDVHPAVSAAALADA